MKILFIANSDSGLYDFRRELITELAKDNEVVLCCPFGKYIEELRKMPVELLNISINNHGMNPFQDIKLIQEYKKIIRRINPDYVLSYTIKPNLYGGIACRALGVKQLANITGLGAVEKPGKLQKMIILMYKYAFKKIHIVFFQNAENRKFFEKNKIAIGKHRQLPGSGVNLEHFKLLEYPTGEETHFLYMSRIMKEKGFDEFVNAANTSETRIRVLYLMFAEFLKRTIRI